MARKVALVPHTHWDREWYEPYQQLRHRLVAMLDELIDDLEVNAGFTRFLLDGQMAVVDDYLEMRPHAEPRLRSLAISGRISVGPWYILMDEFCVSAETIVRNLQLGQQRAEAFGGAMPVGYLPDMFGHVAQMPQILRQAGLDHAVVWRGVPRAVNRSAFWWRAPDGSTVRAEYLPVGYGIGAHLPTDVDAFLRRLRAEERELAPFLRAPDDAVLLMNGSDHLLPQAHVPALVRAVDAATEDFDVAVASLAEYLADAPTRALPEWSGELRSGARANLLAGVLSNRTDIKVAAAVAERALERMAEPLAALWMSPEAWPSGALEAAWLHMIHNSAHDSICACSSDEVGRAVQFRFSEATTLAASVTADALRQAAGTMSATGPVVINPSPRTRSGLIEVVHGGADPVPGAQVVDAVAGAVEERTGTGADLERMFGSLRHDGWLGDGWGSSIDVTVDDRAVEVRIVDDPSVPADEALTSAVAEAFVSAGAHRSLPLRLVVERRASQRLVAAVDDVAGFGWKAWRPAALTTAPVQVDASGMDNGLIQVVVDPDDGTFSLNGVAGLGLLADGGDDGDTYTYSPPADDRIIDRPHAVTVDVVESGPVRGRLRVGRRFSWPAALEDGRRIGARDVTVISDLEVRVGERLVRVETRFDNPARDHRLRAVFPLPHRAERSRAECAFATVERGLEAEGGPNERGLATYPSRRFVCAGGLTVTHEGLLEYEVVDDGQALALTLLRATGMLSKPAPAYRPNPAGPSHPLQAPQMIGPVSCRYAVALGEEDPYDLTDQAWTDLAVVQATGEGWRPGAGSDLVVRGAQVSSLRRVVDALELRVFNPTPGGTVVEVAGRSGRLVDLTGASLEAWDGSFVLGPWALATARLDT